MEFLRQYFVAVHHFTRIPLSGGLGEWAGIRPGEDLQVRAAHWPGVGWFVGLVACVSFAAVGLLLQHGVFAPLVAAVGSTMATVLLTRAFHEEGLARFAETLRVPREPAGHTAVIALVLVMLAKVSLLAVLASHSPVAVLLALLCAHVVTRFWPLVAVRFLPYALEVSAKEEPLAAPITNRELGLAAAWCAPALLAAMVFQGVAFVLLALLLSAGALWLMKTVQERRHSGFTSDGLGATQQVCELAFYFGAAISLAVG